MQKRHKRRFRTKSRKNKMNSFPLIAILLIVGLLGLLVFGFTQQTAFSDTGRIRDTIATFIDETETTVTYFFEFNYEPVSKGGDCNQNKFFTETISVPSLPTSEGQLPKYVEDIDRLKNPAVNSIEIKGLVSTNNICSDKEQDLSIIYDKKEADCSIKPGTTIDGIQRAEISCKLSLRAHGENQLGEVKGGKFSGLNRGLISLTFFKKGVPQEVEEQTLEIAREQVVESTSEGTTMEETQETTIPQTSPTQTSTSTQTGGDIEKTSLIMPIVLISIVVLLAIVFMIILIRRR